MTLYNGGVPTCISIHALREEGDQGRADRARPEGSISIHALREEGDNEDNNVDNVHTEFLSTPSARRATIAGKEWGFSLAISIHALREEGDYWDVGGRSAYFKFLSTPSARRATIRQFRRQSC